MAGYHTPYFIGIALPDELSEQLFILKWQLHRNINHSLRPLVPHITLLHPSSLRTSPQKNILPTIQTVAKKYLPLDIELRAIGNFSHTVLYVAAHSSQLSELQSELVSLLPEVAQQTYHQRGYQPHVTLLQTRSPEVLEVKSLEKHLKQVITLPRQFTVHSLSCFTQDRPREYSAVTL